MWIGDVSGTLESPHYVILASDGNPPGNYEGWCFSEPPGETTGPFAPRNIHTVRAIALLRPELSEAMSLTEEVTIDWGQQFLDWMSAVVSSHIEAMADSVRMVNQLFNQLGPSNSVLEASASRYCPNCGVERIPSAKFCANCGSQL